MNVKCPRNASPLEIQQRRARERTWKDAEICTAGCWKTCAEHASGRRWNFEQSALGPREPVGVGIGLRVPIAVGTPNGEKARVVLVAFLDQDVQSPLTSDDNRKTRSPVTKHWSAHEILEDILGATDRLAEFRRRLLRRAPVIRSVRCDLVPCFCERAHHPRVSLRYPPENEAC